MSTVKNLEIRGEFDELVATVSDHDLSGERDGVTFTMPTIDEDTDEEVEDVLEISNEDASALRDFLNTLDLGGL